MLAGAADRQKRVRRIGRRQEVRDEAGDKFWPFEGEGMRCSRDDGELAARQRLPPCSSKSASPGPALSSTHVGCTSIFT